MKQRVVGIAALFLRLLFQVQGKTGIMHSVAGCILVYTNDMPPPAEGQPE